jgi:hypothetical protein
MASSATGPHTTPPHLAVVVKGIPTVLGPLQQGNRYAGGSYFFSEDEDDSPPLVDLPAVLKTSTAAVSTTGVIAAAAPEHLEDVLAAVSKAEHRRNREFNANMMALDGRDSRLKRMLSDMRGDIALIWEDTIRITSESIALVELNKITRLAVASNMTDYLQSVEATEVQNRQALEAYKQSITVITEAHNNTMDNMQWQLRSSFDRQRLLDKRAANKRQEANRRQRLLDERAAYERQEAVRRQQVLDEETARRQRLLNEEAARRLMAKCAALARQMAAARTIFLWLCRRRLHIRLVHQTLWRQ